MFVLCLALLAAAPCAAQWNTLASMPSALGEVAAAHLGGVVYVVGQGLGTTYTYSVRSGQWGTVATRPYVGNHHAVVTPGDGNMWLVGGFGAESQVTQFVVLSRSFLSRTLREGTEI